MKEEPESTENTEESFEKILDNLREIVEDLEQGDLPLEESLRNFEKGITLSRKAAKRLQAAERRVEILLVDEEGAMKASPFSIEEESSKDSS